MIRAITTAQREAEVIGFIKKEPNKTPAFMPGYESTVYVLLFHNTIPHQYTRSTSTPTPSKLQVHTHPPTQGSKHTTTALIFTLSR